MTIEPLAPAFADRGKPNRLAREKSPYLLQHARNPVDWHPWGEEAFQKARREDRPVFLSIGYATCHWCHVMERESFSDPKVAELLNRYFVPIKVDREERPDVDRVYMAAVQAMTQGGGWPLNVWLTPGLKPFFGGTYFPPRARLGQPGFPEIIERVARLWREKRPEVVASGERLQDALGEYLGGGPSAAGGETPGPDVLDAAYEAFASSYDPEHGGFSGAPKFPMPVNQNFLLRYWLRTKEDRALTMVLHTLRRMALGGIYDAVGGGFSRYSTDALWRVPHFEKMLYDNALLAVNYLEAYQASGDEEFARTARETLDYVLRDMTHSGGGFYSAEDADSLPRSLAGKVPDLGHEHRLEGAFYVWEKWEILKAVGKDEGEVFCAHYGVKDGGNVGTDPHGEFRNKNVLHVAETLQETARRFGRAAGEVEAVLKRARRRLLEERAKRPRPQRDDKILVSWNGLMISALARGAQILDEPDYLKAAEEAARFVQANLYDPGGRRLHHRWREGERKVSGMAGDYAFLAQGLIDLYEASFDVRWLEWALELSEEQNRLFYDRERGGFYGTAAGHDKNLPLRALEDADNVEPAAGSVAALNLLRLAQFADREDFREAAEKTLRRFGASMKERPRSLPQMLAALDFASARHQQIVIAGKPGAPDTVELLRRVHGRFLPHKILLLADGGKGQEALARRLEFLKGVAPIAGKATAYVCVNFACEFPTNDPQVLAAILDGRPSPRGR